MPTHSSEYISALNVYHKLKASGYQSFFAGGAVRDQILNRPANDYDIATQATPDQVEALFAQTISIGKKFGVVIVMQDGYQIEVTTFRKDLNYQDGRRPESVQFSSAEEDAHRRDFTINALFLDPDSSEIIDYVEGKKDLALKVIKAVGQAEQRFQEDHLRILRALRFVSQLDFTIEEKTWQAIKKHSELLKSVSRERIFQELDKLLKGKAVDKALDLCTQAQIFSALFPELQLKKTQAHENLDSQKLNWQNFSTSEPWFDFWRRLGSTLAEGDRKQAILTSIRSLKASDKFNQKLEKSLAWFWDSQLFSKMAMGELLEKSFDPDVFLGMKQFIFWQQNKLTDSWPDSELNKKWEEFLKHKAQFGHLKPAPLCAARDLQGQFQGEHLGRALKHVYWAQLEGRVTDLQSALDWLKDFR